MVPSTDNVRHKDEVIGKECWIEFYVTDTKFQFFRGRVREVWIRMSEKDETERQIQHYIVFDDGDERWFDLYNEEIQGRLKWKTEETTKKHKRSNKNKKKSITDHDGHEDEEIHVPDAVPSGPNMPNADPQPVTSANLTVTAPNPGSAVAASAITPGGLVSANTIRTERD